MVGRVLLVFSLLMIFMQGSAHAQSGEVILEDVAYGAAIGGLLGGAIYLLDQDDFGEKIGTGVALGAIAGFVLGVSDVRSVVEVENDEVKLAMPSVVIDRRGKDLVFSAGVLKVDF